MATALGEKSCAVREDQTSPLVVDWKLHQRAELELAMAEGIAVVEYTCDTIRLLPHCKVPGRYKYSAVTVKEEVLQLKSADELRAALPKTGALLGAQLEADFDRGTTLDVAMVLVGQTRAEGAGVRADQLGAECAGATHFVRAASLGAFASGAGSRAKIRGVVEIFGGGGGAESTSARVQHSKDGSLEACRASSPGDNAPPRQCGALLRINVAEIVKVPAPPVVVATPRTDPTRSPALEAPPHGTSASGTCNSTLPQACLAECRAGNDFSCCRYGVSRLEEGDVQTGYAFSERACNGGSPWCCNNVGALLEGGRGVRADLASALAHYNRGCNSGNELGCANYIILANKQGRGAEALADMRRRCANGNRAACDGVRLASERR